ncbi:MAG: hypothetical protein ABII26_03500, partial [Pseudomonadota bacterium]
MLKYRNGRLFFEGRSFEDLAQGMETPFFLVSEARIRANYRALVQGLSRSESRSIVRYCAKTNNESGVLKILADCGSHVLASHPAEAGLALACGFIPEKIAYQRPVIRGNEIRALLEDGITLIHAHRLQDIGIIEGVAAALKKRVSISLRVRNDSSGSLLSPLGFLSRRMGFTESQMFLAAKRIRESKWLALAAINIYVGTQQQAVSRYR